MPAAIRVLHVWNTAGVASVIAKFTDKTGATRSRVMTRRKFDRVGLTYYGKAYDDGALVFYVRALSAARLADVVHVHSVDRIVPLLKRLYGRKPVVMHYHGTDILGRWEEKRPRWERADLVAYSTPNLADGAPGTAVHIPNPVDTDLFHPRPTPREAGTALSIRYGSDAETEAIAKSRGLSLRWLERGTPHESLPEYFAASEFYLDIRTPVGFASPVRSLGKAAREALASGCKVIDWSGAVHEGLPPECRPEEVASSWVSHYRRLLGQRAG